MASNTPGSFPSSLPEQTQWLTDLVNKQQAMFGSFGAFGGTVPSPDATAASGDPAQQMMAPWLEAAKSFTAWQQQSLQQMAGMLPDLTTAFPGAAAAVDTSKDKRFSGEKWSSDPRFDITAKTYLAQANAMQSAITAMPVDERVKGQWGFMLRQVVDALSPANWLATNPEAIQTALDSGGQSLVEGTKLFMQDLAKGRISMTDETAFEVGRNVALTPGTVVFENELFQLIQYTPTTAKVYERPFVVVPPCINKYYILDLQPENSFVGYAASQGHTVFLVSWRNIGPDQATFTWDDYLQTGVMKALDVACRIGGSDRVNALGFCVGGALLTSALAVMQARGEEKVASFTLLTTMLDYSDTGELGLLITEQSVASREAAIGKGGLLHGRELAQVFAALRANDLIWPYVVNGYLQGKAPPAFDLLFWNGDDSNLPGPMYCWYIRNTYLENKLSKPGGTVQCGIPIDLKKLTLPAFLYASREDHIVPWQTAYESTKVLGGETTFVLGASGHIAGVINPPAKKKRNYWVGGSTASNADAWLESAQSVPGSWWTAWSEWLAKFGGAQVDAPKNPGNAEFAPIEAAPGRYVREKAV
jgi:polyhydroxyalkanoate synthase